MDKGTEYKEGEPEPKETTTTIPRPSFVYLLECTDGSTYVGATMDLDHRLRQHNKEIKGGAIATSRKVVKGETWRRVCHVKNFPDWKSALQFEWRFKHLSRKICTKTMKPIEKRRLALSTLLSMERSTSNAVPYSEWGNPPEVVWE